jgi:nucleoside-diphosphate-sugar epimerase
MRVFVTGGSGFCGSAVIPQLIAAGHTVSAIARSDKSADKLKSWGVSTVVKGDIVDLEILSEQAKNSEALCDGLLAGNGTNKTFVGTSGTLGLTGLDESSTMAASPHMPRYLSDQLTMSYKEKGLRVMIVRLSPVVHGPGKENEHPFVTGQIAATKKAGFAAYVEGGSNLWPSVHVKDAASLYVLGLEKAPSGVSLHGAAEEGIPTKEIAEFIAKKMGVEAKNVNREEAMAHFGWLGMIMQLGGKVTTEKTREWTGWKPVEYGLFEELENYTY